ncbi:MAG: translational GTPase TypA [Candidatus Omnitrophica bacterium]|nr:translational GTPase TypA [Candidatus Omnitrophota bacterium]
MTPVDKIRNLAIIAHIDHGKTTLIDSIFRSAKFFRDNQQVEERMMDNNEIERERGITIRSKHCTVHWNDYLINIIDTPGHADFSGEVERVLSMVDSVLLLVDANEGPMPQTRYVLMRALRLGLKPIVIVNKVDRPNAQPDSALDKTFDLFLELGANDEQADFPVLYGSGLDGWLVRDLDKDAHEGMEALFETIVEKVPPPDVDQDGPFLMQISSIAWNDYIGRIGCGRVLRGKLKKGQTFRQTMTAWKEAGNLLAGWDEVEKTNEKAVHLWETRGLERAEVDEISAGDIVWIAGPAEIGIGDTFAAVDCDEVLKPLEIEEPTVSMFFLVNDGPFGGDEGNAMTLRQIKERIEKELRTNVALRMEDLGRADGVKVSGRGELHLGILIEEMRREGNELCVSRPEVILHVDETGATLEPMEQLIIDVPEEYQGTVIEKLAKRKGELKHMENPGTGVLRLEFDIPTRGLIGYRTDFLTDTRGLGIMSSRFIGYGPWKGEVASRTRGSLVSMEGGQSTSYQLENLQQRATLFIGANEKVYEGQIVGENSRPEDMPCNPTKKKAMTNHRSATKEVDTGLKVPRKMGLDAALEWISDDELVEVTPQSIRLRKAILNAENRKQAQKKQLAMAG